MKRSLCLWLFALMMLWVPVAPGVAFAQSTDQKLQNDPYVAPPYDPPPKPEPVSQLKDNGDGTVTDPRTGLMWAKADSYAELGKCLDWHKSIEYIKALRTGGYDDWRLPSVRELGSIYELEWDNVGTWDRDPDHPIQLDPVFAEGAAYIYWSSNVLTTPFTECCARSVYFVNALVLVETFTACKNHGVRAVRDTVK